MGWGQGSTSWKIWKEIWKTLKIVNTLCSTLCSTQPPESHRDLPVISLNGVPMEEVTNVHMYQKRWRTAIPMYWRWRMTHWPCSPGRTKWEGKAGRTKWEGKPGRTNWEGKPGRTKWEGKGPRGKLRRSLVRLDWSCKTHFKATSISIQHCDKTAAVDANGTKIVLCLNRSKTLNKV